MITRDDFNISVEDFGTSKEVKVELDKFLQHTISQIDEINSPGMDLVEITKHDLVEMFMRIIYGAALEELTNLNHMLMFRFGDKPGHSDVQQSVNRLFELLGLDSANPMAIDGDDTPGDVLI